MEHLPPVGWADVATKTDLDHQRTLDAKLESTIGRGLREQTRTLLVANLGYVTAVGTFVLAAAKL